MKKSNMKKLLTIVASGSLLISSGVNALTAKVSRVGCHIDSNVCFVYLDKPITTDCPHNDGSVRWDGESNTNGKAALSIFLSAEAANKNLVFGLSGCYSGFPSFSWVSTKK